VSPHRVFDPENSRAPIRFDNVTMARPLAPAINMGVSPVVSPCMGTVVRASCARRHTVERDEQVAAFENRKQIEAVGGGRDRALPLPGLPFQVSEDGYSSASSR
jgi:hypothetical protein